jgi:alpha-glucosidase
LSIDTEFGKAEITVFSDGIFRMRIVKDSFQDDFSYAVSGKPEKCEVKLEESNEKLILSTAKLKLEINRNPVRFAFYAPDGKTD